MRYSPQKVELALYPPQRSLRRHEELEVSELESVTDHSSAEVTKKASIWYEEVEDEDGHECEGPGGDLEAGDATAGVRWYLQRWKRRLTCLKDGLVR